MDSVRGTAGGILSDRLWPAWATGSPNPAQRCVRTEPIPHPVSQRQRSTLNNGQKKPPGWEALEPDAEAPDIVDQKLWRTPTSKPDDTWFLFTTSAPSATTN